MILFEILSMVVALYAAYLTTCRLYKLDYKGEMIGKVVYPRIFYIFSFAIAFIPFLNVIYVLCCSFVLFMWSDDYHVKSWLFERPEQKGKETEGE